MANTVTVTKLLDGPRNVIHHVYIKSDGTSGDLDSVVIVDPVVLGMTGEAVFTLDDVTWGFNGFSASLMFDVFPGDDTLIWVLPVNAGNYVDFKKYGGLRDRSNSLDGTGKLLLSTTGLQDVGDEGSLVIKLRKHEN